MLGRSPPVRHCNLSRNSWMTCSKSLSCPRATARPKVGDDRIRACPRREVGSTGPLKRMCCLHRTADFLQRPSGKAPKHLTLSHGSSRVPYFPLRRTQKHGSITQFQLRPCASNSFNMKAPGLCAVPTLPRDVRPRRSSLQKCIGNSPQLWLLQT